MEEGGQGRGPEASLVQLGGGGATETEQVMGGQKSKQSTICDGLKKTNN